MRVHSHRGVLVYAMRSATLVVTLALIPFSWTGCQGETCSAGATEQAPPLITVVDAKTGAAICDATVVVLTDPDAGPTDAASASDTLTSSTPGPGANCRYGGPALDAPGNIDATFTIQVSKAGFKTVIVPEVTTSARTCSGGPQSILQAHIVNVQLEPL